MLDLPFATNRPSPSLHQAMKAALNEAKEKYGTLSSNPSALSRSLHNSISERNEKFISAARTAIHAEISMSSLQHQLSPPNIINRYSNRGQQLAKDTAWKGQSLFEDAQPRVSTHEAEKTPTFDQEHYGPPMSTREAKKPLPPTNHEAFSKAVNRAAGKVRRGERRLPVDIGGAGEGFQLVSLGRGGYGGGHQVRQRHGLHHL